ncbi:hypothetical protein SO802_019675 [Lithocarpus litseifolius]|uniref:Uncharacterized protein n=1 Tax=Lithocarpus litseifolius TaxID=425828 RepID=A0AAW2CRD3_9ROSI
MFWHPGRVCIYFLRPMFPTFYEGVQQVELPSQCTAEEEATPSQPNLKEEEQKLEEAEKAVEKAKQDGYDVGVAKTGETLKAEVFGVCRTYCIQVWNEALNQAGVEASFALRRAENIYYPSAIRALGLSGSKVETSLKDPDPSKGIPTKALPSSNNPPKEAEQAGAVEKAKDTTKGVVPEATKPLAAPKDPLRIKTPPQSLEIVLGTLPMFTKEDSKGKGPTSTTVATAKPTKATAKDNPPLKIK